MINIVDEPIATVNSIELHITSTGGELTNWQYNLYWGHPDKWVDGTLIANPGEASKLIINQNVAMCTEYGVSVRAKASNGRYVTSDGFKYVKTKGYAEVTSVRNFVIGTDDNVFEWKWNIFNTGYYYDVTIVNAKDDPIVMLCEDEVAKEVGNNLEASGQLTDEQMNALYAAGPGNYEFWVTTKDNKWQEGTNGNILGVSHGTFQIVLSTYTNKLKPEFTDFTITPSGEILKGHTEVTIDYRLQLNPETGEVISGAKAKYGATITKFIVVVGGEDHHLEDVYCEGIAKFTPKISGNVEITITARDSRGYETEVRKTITVTDYEDIQITSANAYRYAGSNKIYLELKGKCYKQPTIICNYTPASEQSWQTKDQVLSCSFIESEHTFTYSGEAFTVDTSSDILVGFLITDGLSAASFTPYIYSSSVITIEGAKVNNIPTAVVDVKGRVNLNGHGVMGYMSTTSVDNAEIDSGIYDTTYDGNSGFLEVIAGPNMKMQRLTVYHNDNPNRYDVWLRFYVNSSFTEWKQFTNKGES